MTNRGHWPGTWAAICDRCGFRFPSDEITKEWQGLMVCDKCFETRHPQDFIRGVPDNPAPPWTRPEPPDEFISWCPITQISAYAGTAGAGCAQAGQTFHSFDLLYNSTVTIPEAT